MTNQQIILIGVGEIGGVLARGFLRLGYSVHPVNRDTDMQALAEQVETPALVVVAVGEQALQPVLSAIPAVWRDRLCLLQNELLPQDWQGIPQPTVISIWFEKKPGQDAKVIIPSPLFGPGSELVCAALEAVSIPCQRLQSEDDLLRELVIKNLYILTTNIAGLEAGGNVDQLWREHQSLASDVATDVLTLQEALTGHSFDRQMMIDRMLEAFAGDPQHQCMGRSAPARLERALEHAKRFDLRLPTLERISRQSGNGS